MVGGTLGQVFPGDKGQKDFEVFSARRVADPMRDAERRVDMVASFDGNDVLASAMYAERNGSYKSEVGKLKCTLESAGPPAILLLSIPNRANQSKTRPKASGHMWCAHRWAVLATGVGAGPLLLVQGGDITT